LLAEAEAIAIKRVIAFQISQLMSEQSFIKASRKAMHTRSFLNIRSTKYTLYGVNLFWKKNSIIDVAGCRDVFVLTFPHHWMFFFYGRLAYHRHFLFTFDLLFERSIAQRRHRIILR
jgi:hypothetical protein